MPVTNPYYCYELAAFSLAAKRLGNKGLIPIKQVDKYKSVLSLQRGDDGDVDVKHCSKFLPESKDLYLTP